MIRRISAFVGSLLRAKPAAKVVIRIIGSVLSGQGSCLLVESNGLKVVLDCGSNSTNLNVAGKVSTQSVAEQILQARPDFIVPTHFHADHAGFQRVVETYRTARLPFPPFIATDVTWKLVQQRWFGQQLPSILAKRMGFRGESNRIRLIPTKHSVIGSAGVLVLGPKNVLYTSDFWAMELPADLPKIDMLIVNCTTVRKSEPRDDKEVRIRQNVLGLIKETLVKNSSANCYVAMFSTQLERAMWLEQETLKLTGRLPVILGISLINNLDAVRPDSGQPRSSRIALTTGVWAHGEDYLANEREGISALVKLANDIDRYRQLKPGDLVVLSGSIPTWHHELPRLIESMCRKLRAMGVRLVVDVSAPSNWEQFAERREVHAGGHGNMPEITDLIDRVKPKMVMPFHASHEDREVVAKYCESRGIKVIKVEQSSIITL